MAKKILFGMVTIIILVIAYYSYVFFYATRQHSPEDTAIYQKADLDITLQYSRPYKKGRVIFAQSDEALQPYGKYWRLGANQATKLTVNRPVSILGNVWMPEAMRFTPSPGSLCGPLVSILIQTAGVRLLLIMKRMFSVSKLKPKKRKKFPNN